MRTIEQTITEIWTRTMPKDVPVPPEYSLYLWSKKHLDDVTYAIARTAEKVEKNRKENIPFADDFPARYTSSIIRCRTEWRQQQSRLEESHV